MFLIVCRCRRGRGKMLSERACFAPERCRFALYALVRSRARGRRKGKKDALRESVFRSGSLTFRRPCSRAGGRGEKKKKKMLCARACFAMVLCVVRSMLSSLPYFVLYNESMLSLCSRNVIKYDSLFSMCTMVSWSSRNKDR